LWYLPGRAGRQQDASHATVISAAMQALRAWLAEPDAEAFPYEVVVAEFNRVGKHFVPRQLLLALDAARVTLSAPAARNARSHARPLPRTARWTSSTGATNIPSYLGVDLLPLPGAGGDEDADAASPPPRPALRDAGRGPAAVRARGAPTALTPLLPELRPDARLTAKRCRLAVRALRPALARLGLRCDVLESDGLAGAREVLPDRLFRPDRRSEPAPCG
jgi:hypothetical protein